MLYWTTVDVLGPDGCAVSVPCSLDISPLLELARQNYSAEIIKYAGGSPLSGMTAAAPIRAIRSHACLRLAACVTGRNVAEMSTTMFGRVFGFKTVHMQRRWQQVGWLNHTRRLSGCDCLLLPQARCCLAGLQSSTGSSSPWKQRSTAWHCPSALTVTRRSRC